jgi:molybdate transport system permease protein
VRALPDLDPVPILLTLKLAAVSTLVLLVLGVPLALWIVFGRSRLRPVLEAIVGLPLILPPTVLGFYLLVLLGPNGPVGSAWESVGGARLVFSFSGLVIGSVLYSLPFVVHPLANAFGAVDRKLLEAARTLGANRLDRLTTVLLPLSRRGFVTAITLGFAHTVGEFGVVLLIGGNIPGRTQVLSIAIYDHVEALSYPQAHALSALLLAFSFAALLSIYAVNRKLDVVGSGAHGG